MRVVYSLLFVLLFTVTVEAQESENAFTIQQCIDYAKEHNESLKIADLDRQIAKGTIGETRALGLPQVNASIGVQHNINIQTSFIQDFISPATYEVLFQEELLERRDLGPPATFPAQFGVPNSGNAGISVSQLLFNGSYFVGLEAARSLKDLRQKEYVQSEIELVENVTKAYYLVLITRENVELLANNFARLDKLFTETSAMYENGFAEKIDVSRLKIQRNNLKTDLATSTELLKVSLSTLKLQMGMPMSQPLTLVDDLSSVKDGLQEVDALNGTPADRIEYSILEENRNLALLDIKNNKVQYLPNAYLGFNHGWTSGTNSFGDLFNLNDETWFKYTNIGATINIPIFDGLEKRYKVQQAKATLNQVELGMDQLENSIQLEVQAARINMNNAIQNLENQEENADLAEEIYEITRIKYLEGVGSNLEVIEADTEYKNSQTNYYNALYDAIISKIELQKALGILK
ncbi:MAG: TolC family protein [bacterium]|nr:TolC family protein [bacterium]